MTITYSDDNGHKVSVTDECSVTWVDAIDVFFKLLRGAGFQLNFDDGAACAALENLHDEAR